MRTGAACLLASATLASPALAQQQVADANEATRVDEIVVTGRRETDYRVEESSTIARTPLSLIETPNAVSIVTRDLIQDRRARTVSEALEVVPGIVRSFNNYGIEQFKVRGFETGSSVTTTTDGLLSSGRVTPDPAFVERYEVLKGPASIISGGSTPGGVINRVTIRPVSDPFQRFEGQAASRSFFKALGDLNLPLAGDLGARATAVHERGDGFVDGVEIRRTSVGLSLRYGFGAESQGSITVSGRLQREGGVQSRGVPLLTDGSVPDIDRSTGVFGEGSVFDRDNEELFIDAELKLLGDLTLRAKGLLQDQRFFRRDIYAYNFGGVGPDGSTYVYGGFGQFDSTTLAGDVSLEYAPELWGQKQSLIVGVNPSRFEGDVDFGYGVLGTDNLFNPANNLVVTPADVPSAVNGTYVREDDQLGLFAQLLIRPADRLSILAAGRYERFSGQFNNADGSVDRSRVEKPFTTRVGVSYGLTDDLYIYGSFAESFTTQYFSRDADGVALPPETGKQFEVGGKINLASDRLTVTASLFDVRRQNVARQVAPNVFETVGEQRHRGLELEAAGEPFPGLSIALGYSYIDAEITKDPNGSRLGNRPSQVPEHSFSSWLRYGFEDAGRSGPFVAGGVYAIGSRFLTDFETLRVAGYARVDLSAGYRWKSGTELNLFVRNVGDRRYLENVTSVNGVNFFGEPRTINLSLRFSL